MSTANQEAHAEAQESGILPAAPVGSLHPLVGPFLTVNLGDLYTSECAVCGCNGYYGLATKCGPEGCVEAVRAGRVYCDDHIHEARRPNYWIMNNFVVFVPIIMANNFVK